MLTSKEYVKKEGLICPFCGSTNVHENSSVDRSDGTTFYQDIICLNCEKEWQDIFTLTSYSEIDLDLIKPMDH